MLDSGAAVDVDPSSLLSVLHSRAGICICRAGICTMGCGLEFVFVGLDFVPWAVGWLS